MNNNNKDVIRIGFMNVRGQTGLDEPKQFQIEQFIQIYKIDILNCQEINVDENSFRYCKFISANFDIITNNASNKYGTCTFTPFPSQMLKWTPMEGPLSMILTT